MPRIYISSDSYPELREIESLWQRHRTWSRAFFSACGDYKIWRFFFVQFALVVGMYFLSILVIKYTDLSPLGNNIGLLALVGVTILITSLLSVTWGGDLMRPHLRKVSEIARDSCPSCGHLLTGHLAGTNPIIACPECGERIEREIFSAPYRIPRRYLAIGPGTGSHASR